jgi:hypothetical protein
MLLTLPTFFALGFAFGYLWPYWPGVGQERQTAEARALAWRRAGTWSAVLLIVLAVLLLPWPAGMTGRGLAVAGAVVGTLAGRWYRGPNSTRDQLAFIASAGVFPFFAALEYDHKLFGNLAKFGGAGVSVEFANQDRNVFRSGVN